MESLTKPNRKARNNPHTVNKPRLKGKRGELEFAKFLGDHGIPSHRTQQFCGTAGDSDVRSPGLAVHWEVKRTERFRIEKAYQQAHDDAKEGYTPIVAWRPNNSPWYAILSMEDLVGLIHLARQGQQSAGPTVQQVGQHSKLDSTIEDLMGRGPKS